MVDAAKIVKNVFKAIWVVIFSFFEAITVSFYKNIKRHWNGPSSKYREVKIPKDYEDSKLEPEYKELGSNESNYGAGMGMFK
tara:strand:+ start:13581 stop:13826 length:246 start_codon:yes stop_codon:yes gene_type:complete